jgi:hypothetical protein
LVLEGRLSGSGGLAEVLRQRSEQGSLPSCPEGSCLPPSSLLPARPDSAGMGVGMVGASMGSGGPGARRGSASQSGSLHSSGTPRTPMSAEYAQALQRNSQRLLDAVASSASSGVGGSAENPVPLPEQETLMLPLAALPEATPGERVKAAARAAAQAGELPPEAGEEGPREARRRNASAAAAKAEAEAAAADGAGPAAEGGASAAAALACAASGALGGDDAAPGGAALGEDACTCPPYAVKATCGKRPIMEDTYALCPNICELPMRPMTRDGAPDKLPQRIAVKLAANGAPACPEGAQAAAAADGAAAHVAPHDLLAALASSGGTFSSPVEAAAAPLEKLHFFGVYDGHGGIQASQHCAARLHHHLSACLRDMATDVLGHAPADGADAGGRPEARDAVAWRGAVVPEVRCGCA